MKAALPPNEVSRLATLRDYAVLDTAAEPAFDDLTLLAMQVCETPTALITLVDEKRQWFKSRRGFAQPQTPREIAFCAHTILGDGVTEVHDATRDPRFADNPLVTGPPHIRFYAGAPLLAEGGHRLGALAVVAGEPRCLTPAQREALAALARHVVVLLELRRGLERERHRSRFAGAALRQSDERLQRAVEAGNIGLWDWDLLANAIYFSAEAKRHIGFQAHELGNTVETWVGRIHPEDRTRVSEALRAALIATSADPFSVEFRLRHRDGTYRWILSQAEVLRDEQGRAARLLGSHVDITPQKQIEQALQGSDERYRLVGRATNDAIWDWDLRTNLLWWSEGFQTLFGYRAEDIEPGIESWSERVHPNEQARVKAGVKALLAGRELLWRDEYRFRRADGSYAFVLDRGTVIRDAGGVALRMIGAMQDITALREAAEAVRRSEQRLQALMAGAADIVCVIAPDGTLTYVSPAIARLGGYTPEEAMSRNMLDFLHPDDVGPAVQLVAAAIRQPQGIWRGVWRLRHRDGSWRTFESLGRNLVDVPAVAGFVVNLRDISDRRGAEDALRENERLLASLVENLPGVTFRVRNDPHWTAVFVSRSIEDLTGHAAADFMAGTMNFSDVMHPDDRQRVWDTVQAAVAAGRRYQCEYRIRTAAGVEKRVWEQGRGVRDAEGRLDSIEGFLIDITARTAGARAKEA